MLSSGGRKSVVRRWMKLVGRFMSNIVKKKSDVNNELNLLNEPLIFEFGLHPTWARILNFPKATWFRYRYDRKFSPDEDFYNAMGKVFSRVTEKLYDNDFNALHSLVTKEHLLKLETAVKNLSDEHKVRLLGVKDHDDVIAKVLVKISYRIIPQTKPSVQYFDVLFGLVCLRKYKEINPFAFRRKDINSADFESTKAFKDAAKYFDTHALFANIQLTKQIEPSLSNDWIVSYLNYATAVPKEINFALQLEVEPKD